MTNLARWLVYGGASGEAPDYYFVIRAAKYLGVAPWELLEQHPLWQDWAFVCQSAENEAERTLHERAMRKAR